MSKGKAVVEATGKAFNKLNPVEALREVVTAYTEYATVREQEATKRAEIAADLRTTLARIRSQQSIVLTYLDQAFAERKEMFQELFAQADSALISGRTDQLAEIMHTITETAKSSPLAALGDFGATQAMLRNPDMEWTI